MYVLSACSDAHSFTWPPLDLLGCSLTRSLGLCQFKMTSMTTILLVSFMIMATANATPAYDEATSEITLLLQQGSDDSACADLAKNLEDEVTSAVEAANKQLGALNDGSDCKSEGQEAFAAAQSAADNADKAAADAASADQAATESEVDFGASIHIKTAAA